MMFCKEKNTKFKIVCNLMLLFLFVSKTAFPQGDSPCTAVSMTVNSGICGTYTNGTSVGATYSTNAANGGTPTCATPGDPDVWYSFVAPLSGLITITTNAGTIIDSGIQLYSSSNNLCTGTLAALNCNDNSGPGNMSELNLCGLTGGNTYFLRLWNKGAGSTGTFSICFYVPAITAATTNCNGATTVCNDVAFSGNSSGAGTQELNGCNAGCLGGENQSSWYYFTTPTAGNVDLSITPSVATDDYDFAIWGPFTTTTIPCPPNGAPLRCSYAIAAGSGATGVNSTNNAPATDLTEGAGGNQWVQTIASNAGDTYILLVDNFVSSSQPFTLDWTLTAGATLGCTTLPISLVSFEANLVDNNVQLKWITASETNNDYFTIQKSKDAQVFEDVFIADGAGNSTSTIEYFEIDRNPYSGVSYYRLMQTDFDGHVTYSNIVPVHYTPNGDPSIDLFPNPTDTDSQAYLELNQFEGQEILVVLRDVTGREIYSKIVISVSNNELVTLNQDGKLDKGVYLITASSANKLYSKKLIVK